MLNIMLVNMKSIYWLLIVPIILITGLIIAAIVMRIINYRKLKKSIKPSTVDSEQQKLFFEVYGGKDNIIDVKQEMSRLTVEVKDLNKVNLNQLKDLGAKGVLVMGNAVKASFGERAEYISELLK